MAERSDLGGLAKPARIIEKIAVTLRLAPTPIPSIDMAQ